MHKLLPSCPLLSNLHELSKSYNPSIAILFFVVLRCYGSQDTISIKTWTFWINWTTDVRYTRGDEYHISGSDMLATHQTYMMVTLNIFDPFHEDMKHNVFGSNNCDDCVQWYICGQTCHFSKTRWECDYQPMWQQYVLLKNKIGTLNGSLSKMKVQSYKSKIKVHIYSTPFEDGSCALQRRDVMITLMFKKTNTTETDLRVDDILLLYSPALNNSNDLQSHLTHRAFIMINRPTNTSFWSQSRHHQFIKQWYVGQIQRNPMLNCSHSYTNNHSIMIYMEIRFQISHVPLQSNMQLSSLTCSKTKEKQPILCGREDSCSSEQYLQLFKDARSFMELNGIYTSLLTQSRLSNTLQCQCCKDHNLVAIQHHYDVQLLLTDTQVHKL